MRTIPNSRRKNPSLSTDNTDNSSFRLVAIRPYAGSSQEALKALHLDTTYFLVGDYKDKYENGKWVDIEKSSEVGPLPHDFFSVEVLDENQHPLKIPFVNISAIVGKNGCGKSSLIEFLIRLINNVAIKEEFSPSQDSQYAEGTYGRVYYEIDKHLHYIDCSFSEEKEDKMIIDYSDKSEDDKINKENFFYSIISNYSLYAYNSKEHDKIWFDDLFHKNDSYQMPVVITPVRHKGNIDINVENDLAKLRLISIFGQSENSIGRKINDQKYAEGVKITLITSSKLVNYIRDKFKYFKSEDYGLKPRIQDFNEYMRRINDGKYAKTFFSTNEFNYDIQFWTRFDKKFWAKYIDVIDHANLIARQLLPKDKKYAQMYEYFDLLPTILKLRNLDSDSIVEESIEFIKEHCKFINALQFQTLMMIIYICDLWDNMGILGDINCAQIFSKLDEKHECKEARVQAYLYVIYKTITIFKTYEPYNKIFDFDMEGFVLFDGRYEDGTSFAGNLDKCFKLLFDDNDRIKVNYKSLKLRQTLNFLTLENIAEEYDYASKKECKDDVHYNLSFDDIHRIIKGKKENDDEENMSLLPPPIFSTDIVVKENNHKFYLSNMSSGELQMIYSVGGLMYHLRNLDYEVSNDSFIEYKYVSLVLEEVELYFHPAYQQDYVHTLLTYIANTCFKNIKGINILLVTHSPFVLSDIPKQNVLFLEEGMPTYSMQQNTFGANIHSMLQNGFFLNGLPIGEFAKEKINELTKILHNGKDAVDNKDNEKNILNIINLIGEPIVKSQLLKMYSDYKLPYIYENKIKQLEAKIAKLEKKYDKD